MTKLSLLTACYNSSQTIKDTILSVNAQSYDDVEHIIIDGASSDDTVEICERHGTRITKIVSEPDKGIYDAYNKGINYATGEIIGFLNSDDYFASADVLERVMELFADPNLDACHADLLYVDPADLTSVERYWKSHSLSAGDLATGRIPAHPTVFLRRSVYDRIGRFDLRYRLAADYDFLLRAFCSDNFRSHYENSIWVCMRSGGATGGGLRSILDQNREIRQAQLAQDIDCSVVKFSAVKFIDRLAQRINSRGVKAPRFFEDDNK